MLDCRLVEQSCRRMSPSARFNWLFSSTSWLCIYRLKVQYINSRNISGQLAAFAVQPQYYPAAIYFKLLYSAQIQTHTHTHTHSSSSSCLLASSSFCRPPSSHMFLTDYIYMHKIFIILPLCRKKKGSNPPKLFTRLMKRNIPLIFPFTCHAMHTSINTVTLTITWLLFIQPPSWKRSAVWYFVTSPKNLLISKSFITFEMWVFLLCMHLHSNPANCQLVGLFTKQRADPEQGGGHRSQMAVKLRCIFKRSCMSKEFT